MEPIPVSTAHRAVHKLLQLQFRIFHCPNIIIMCLNSRYINHGLSLGLKTGTNDWKRMQIVLLSTQDFSQKAIATKMKCSRDAVQTTLKWFEATGSYSNRPKSRRKRRTTERLDRHLERMALLDTRLSSKDLSTAMLTQLGDSLTASVVRRRLIAGNLLERRAWKKPYLTYFNVTVKHWGGSIML